MFLHCVVCFIIILWNNFTYLSFKITFILFAARVPHSPITCTCDHACVTPICSPVSHQLPLHLSPHAAAARTRLMCIYCLCHIFCANTRAEFWGWFFCYFFFGHLSCLYFCWVSKSNIFYCTGIKKKKTNFKISKHFCPDTGVKTLPQLGGVEAPLIWTNICHRLN